LTVKMRYDTFRLLESMKARIFTWFFSCVTPAMMIPSVTLACAVCVPGVNDPVADAFNWSVLFLMVMPYLVVGSIAGGLFYAHRRAAKREGPESAQPVDHLAWNQKESGR
jgi:hypothetical protein